MPSDGRTGDAARIEAAQGSTDELRALFDDLAAELGIGEASRRWWRWFGARDAAET